jgi:lipoyl(octanoyl) transferase
VTSLADLGLPVTMADLDVALRSAFEEVFGREIAQLHSGDLDSTTATPASA